jgi:hypothetical protein
MTELSKHIYIPTTLEEIFRYAKLLSESTIVPADYRGKPANIVVTIQKGLGLNLAPLQSLECYSIIQGTPAIKSTAYAGLAMRTGELEKHSEVVHKNDEGKVTAADVTIKRKGHDAHVESFTMEQAEKAGLTKNANYNKFPERMLLARANSFAFRKEFADIFMGVGYSAEELQDIPHEEKDVTPTPLKLDSPKLYLLCGYKLPAEGTKNTVLSRIDKLKTTDDIEDFRAWQRENSDVIKEFNRDNPILAEEIKDIAMARIAKIELPIAIIDDEIPNFNNQGETANDQ